MLAAVNSSQEAMMPIDRTLDLNVYVVGQEYSTPQAPVNFQAQVAYIEMASNPYSPGLVEFRTGNIDLTTLARDPSNFTSNVDITFTLVPFMFDRNGNPVQAQWATPITQAIAITPASPEMTPSYVNPMKILLDDNDDNSNRYQYTLAFILPAYDNYLVTCDPVIVNKGRGGK
jgi:hypothetical protein